MTWYLRLSLGSILLCTSCAPFTSDLSSEAELAVTTKPFTEEQAWWKVYKDPLIDELAQKLCSQSIDLKIAAYRVLEAKALAASVNSELLPDLALQARSNRGDRQSRRPATLSEAGIGATWAIDLFGGTRAARNSLEAQARATAAEAEDVRNVVLSELVRSTLEWREAQSSHLELNTLLALQEQQLGLLSARADAGLSNSAPFEEAQATFAQLKGDSAATQARSTRAQYQIERLLGLPPQGLSETLTKYAEPILIVPNMTALETISIDHLRNRPDLRSARAQLDSAEARVKQAEADLWPKVSVTGFFGVAQADEVLNFIVGDNPIWAIGSTLSQPLLNFGKLRNLLKARDAQLEQAAAHYERLTHLALQETSSALSDYVKGINRVHENEKKIASRKRSLQLAEEQFNRGLVDMTHLLHMRLELAQTKLQNFVERKLAAEAYVRLQEALAHAVSGESLS